MSAILLKSSSVHIGLWQGLPARCWTRLCPRTKCAQRQHHYRQQRDAIAKATGPLRAEATTAGMSNLQLNASEDAPQSRVIRSDFLHQAKEGIKLYLVVLNHTLPRAVAQLWHAATARVCADGGANRLYDELPSMLSNGAHGSCEETRRAYLPDLIKGDMDSVRPDVHAFYTSQGVATVDLSADQDTTDLTKCIMYLEERIQSSSHASSSAAEAAVPGTSAGGGIAHDGQQRLPGHNIVVLGAIGGRLDHTLSNLNTLYRFPHLNITLWGEGNLVRLLPPGRSTIEPDPDLEGPKCALVPMAGPVTANTTGLRWNCHNLKLCFCGLISTSNELDGPVVEVDCDDEILWMTQCADELPAESGKHHQRERLLN